MQGRERRGIFRGEPIVKSEKLKVKSEPKAAQPKAVKEVKPKAEKVKTETPLPNKGDGVAGYMEAKGGADETVENLTL